MKKFVSIILAIAMFAVMAIPVSAYTPQPPEEIDEAKSYFMPLFEEEFSNQTGGKTITDINVISTNDVYTIFQFSTESYEKTEYFN